MLNQLVNYAKGLGGSEEVLYFVNHNIANHINGKKKDKVLSLGEYEHIIDYLVSKDAPKRLHKMSVKEAHNNAKKWVKKLTKKGNNIIETEDDYDVVKIFKDGMQVVRLKSEDSYKREGNLMSHCVASYYDRRDNYEVLSLRDANNQPHCTIGVRRGKNGQIDQIKGKGNGSIHPKYIKHVLKILKLLKIDIRSSELENLGYIDLDSVTSGMTAFTVKHFGDSAKFMSFKGTRYFYIHSKLVEVK